MSSHSKRFRLQKLALAMGLAAFIPTLAQPVYAEVRISGNMDAMTVETRDATVEEVLAALRASYNLQYRISGSLDRTLTGTYSGSLQRVVSRILAGQNYTLRSSPGGIAVVILGPGAAGASASPLQSLAGAGQPILPALTNPAGSEGWSETAPISPFNAPVNQKPKASAAAAAAALSTAGGDPDALSTAPAVAPAQAYAAPPPPLAQPQSEEQAPAPSQAAEGWNGVPLLPVSEK